MGGRLIQRKRLAGACAALLATSLACSSVAAPTPTAVPVTPSVTPTRTPRPTATRRPTATPNLDATQRALEFDELLAEFAADGYLESTKGRVFAVEPIDKKLAVKDYFWWYQDELGPTYVFSGQFAWSTATPTLGVSGCGLMFGVTPEPFGYSLMLDDTRLLLEYWDGKGVSRIQPSSGEAHFDFPNPAKAEVSFIARGEKIIVIVDGEVITYKLREKHDASGGFGPQMASSTREGYGTHCTVTAAHVWVAE